MSESLNPIYRWRKPLHHKYLLVFNVLYNTNKRCITSFLTLETANTSLYLHDFHTCLQWVVTQSLLLMKTLWRTLAYLDWNEKIWEKWENAVEEWQMENYRRKENYKWKSTAAKSSYTCLSFFFSFFLPQQKKSSSEVANTSYTFILY